VLVFVVYLESALPGIKCWWKAGGLYENVIFCLKMHSVFEKLVTDFLSIFSRYPLGIMEIKKGEKCMWFLCFVKVWGKAL